MQSNLHRQGICVHKLLFYHTFSHSRSCDNKRKHLNEPISCQIKSHDSDKNNKIEMIASVNDINDRLRTHVMDNIFEKRLSNI